jgi:hypothetical protein
LLKSLSGLKVEHNGACDIVEERICLQENRSNVSFSLIQTAMLPLCQEMTQCLRSIMANQYLVNGDMASPTSHERIFFRHLKRELCFPPIHSDTQQR